MQFVHILLFILILIPLVLISWQITSLRDDIGGILNKSVSLETLQRAARVVEEEGPQGYMRAENLVGKETALALLIAHLQQKFGKQATYPSDPVVERKVEAFLREKGLIANKTT